MDDRRHRDRHDEPGHGTNIDGAPKLFLRFPSDRGFAIAFRLNKNALDRTVRKDGIASVFQDPNRRELTRKRDSLWGHDTNAAEILAFLLLALPLCIAPFSSNVDWLSVGTNSAAFLALLVLWVYIRKANQKTARALQEEIDALNQSSKK